MQTFTLSQATAQGIIDESIELYDAVSLGSGTLPGEQTLLQEKFNAIALDAGLHPDDDYDEIIDLLYEEIVDEYG